MRTYPYVQAILLLGVFASLVSSAGASLTENQVVLLYNSEDADSLAVRNAYIAQHPNVLQFDLDLAYTDPPNGINSHYVTHDRFVDLFLDPTSSFQQFLNANPQVLAIATTRGLPGAVSDDFDPSPLPQLSQPIDGVWCSFEAGLSHPGIVHASGEELLKVDNPYYDDTRPFLTFLQSGDPGVPTAGDMYLVSRLDANSTADTIAVINRSASLTVNMYATTFVFDIVASSFYPAESHCRYAVGKLWQAGWCVMYEDTSHFVRGLNDPAYDPGLDGPFNEYPLIGLYSYGKNSGAPWNWASRLYPQYFDVAVGATFSSLESGNGWTIHEPGTYAWTQGQVLDWISGSVGTFAIGNIQEPTTSNVPSPDPLYPNLYVNGLAWAEAAYTSLPDLGQYQTPIGDPLAVVTAYNPDINGDRVISISDYAVVLANFETSGPEGDVNGNGWVDQDDLDLVLDAYGRDNTENPLTPRLCTNEADLDGDGDVDDDDLDILLADWGECQAPPPDDPMRRCMSDINGDGLIDLSDLATLNAWYGELLGDLNDDGDVTGMDLALLMSTYYGKCTGDPGFEFTADIDNSGCVDLSDYAYLAAVLQN